MRLIGMPMIRFVARFAHEKYNWRPRNEGEPHHVNVPDFLTIVVDVNVGDRIFNS